MRVLMLSDVMPEPKPLSDIWQATTEEGLLENFYRQDSPVNYGS